MVAKLENQRRTLSNRLRKVSSDISHINATRPELGGMYLNQLQPERVQLIRWHDDCVAALEEAKEYTQERVDVPASLSSSCDLIDSREASRRRR